MKKLIISPHPDDAEYSVAGTVLKNTHIEYTILLMTSGGDNVVIGTGSIITKDIPSGSLAMGSPCKVVLENAYPKVLTSDQKDEILNTIVAKWYNLLSSHKNCHEINSYTIEDGGIIIEHKGGGITIFNTDEYITRGVSNEISEDLRDYLRRHGIRIYNGKPFKSMKPSYEKTYNISAS